MHISICMSQPLQTCDVQPRSCILGKCECSLHSKAIFSHSPGTMNIHSRFHGAPSCRVLLFFWDTVLDRWMDHLGWFLGVLLFSLFIYGQTVSLKKKPPSDFLEDISNVTLAQIKRPCAWHWHETSRQGLYAREALLNLAVSEHITGRFQIIVRPVLALVIRHAVLSEARAAGEVKRQWHEVLLLARRGPATSLRMQTDRLWHRFCLDDAQRSRYSCLEIHCYLSRECQTRALQLEL